MAKINRRIKLSFNYLLIFLSACVPFLVWNCDWWWWWVFFLFMCNLMIKKIFFFLWNIYFRSKDLNCYRFFYWKDYFLYLYNEMYVFIVFVSFIFNQYTHGLEQLFRMEKKERHTHTVCSWVLVVMVHEPKIIHEILNNWSFAYRGWVTRVVDPMLDIMCTRQYVWTH